MIFNGISRVFKLTSEEQYETIGRFWDEMSLIYGLENLRGLGYKWENDEIYYAIGLKNGDVEGYNLVIDLPDDGWITAIGETDRLKELYDEIYKIDEDIAAQGDDDINEAIDIGNTSISSHSKNDKHRAVAFRLALYFLLKKANFGL